MEIYVIKNYKFIKLFCFIHEGILNYTDNNLDALKNEQSNILANNHFLSIDIEFIKNIFKDLEKNHGETRDLLLKLEGDIVELQKRIDEEEEKAALEEQLTQLHIDLIHLNHQKTETNFKLVSLESKLLLLKKEMDILNNF